VLLAPSRPYVFPRPRKRSAVEVTLVVVAVAALAMRALEIPGHPLVLLRVLLSAAAVAFLIFGPGATVGRRAVTILVFEAACGIATFTLVDAPFVMEHRPQIGAITIAIADQVERAQRGIANAP